MTAYYNEHDENAAAWLRELIKEGQIADGIVDTRSIVAVEAADLRDFTQCHFFAGIAGWSYALRLAGWPDDRPVWTGSCPCQPFSAAGKREGFNDERHLWPHFHRLIGECRPPVVLGEQVASKDGRMWFNSVRLDLEALGYAVGGADLCAAGLGAPHIRQRLWFVGKRLDDTAGPRRDGALAGTEGAPRDEARLRLLGEGSGPRRMANDDDARREGHGLPPLRAGGDRGGQELRAAGPGAARGLGHDDDDEGLEGQRGGHQAEGGRLGAVRSAAAAGEPRGMEDPMHPERRAQHVDGQDGRHGPHDRRQEAHGIAGARSEVLGLADADGRDASAERQQRGGEQRQQPEDGGAGDGGRPGPVNGHWRDADWLYCRDGKWRPVEPGTFPLAHGLPARVGRLRGYGNAIVPSVAAAFIEAVME